MKKTVQRAKPFGTIQAGSDINRHSRDKRDVLLCPMYLAMILALGRQARNLETPTPNRRLAFSSQNCKDSWQPPSHGPHPFGFRVPIKSRKTIINICMYVFMYVCISPGYIHIHINVYMCIYVLARTHTYTRTVAARPREGADLVWIYTYITHMY